MRETIVTQFDAKPVPDRRFDWSATSPDFDYADDTGGSHPVGYGSTEAEAIADYLTQVEER